MTSTVRVFVSAAGLIVFLFLAGISSEAMAAPPQKVTICHMPTDGQGNSKTFTLPAHVAQGHLDAHPLDFTGKCEQGDFVIVAVSGTLEEGFPLRPNLDFISPTERVNAIFLGHALVRGLRAFLDIKDPNSREFREPPALNPVNPALLPSGNKFDANISSIYLVDRRQAVRALLNEPRYLSMVPDLAKVDIHAAQTSPAVRALILQAIQETPLLEPKNTTQATFLQVISTWKSCHFVPSPVLTVLGDGTRITDFPNSLAAFAGTTDAERISDPDSYNAKVEAAIRAAVVATGNCVEPGPPFPVPSAAELANYAVDKSTKRMNDTYRPCEFEEFAARAGLNIQVAQCPN
ncbi:MAG TPA: hypothetical protein VGC99_18600 [Candidatus Tectomicrobia bacterium]